MDSEQLNALAKFQTAIIQAKNANLSLSVLNITLGKTWESSQTLQPERAAPPTEQAAPLVAHTPSEKHRKFVKQDSEKLKRLVIAAYERKKEQLKNNPHLKRKFIIEELSKDFNLSNSTIYKYVQGR